MSVHIRDPVHNFIRLQDEERRLLGTPVFQRLRGIRQLALATLVYPGALHTRFDHSLGVMHVAGQMAQSLGMGEDDIGRVRLAALLHDVGHGPFSHVSEYALERYADRTTLQPEQKKEKIHELVSALIIRNNADIVLNLGQAKCDEIAKLLATGYGETALRQVVSGPLDADKQDYLLRDSYFCGVQYGIFDHHQLHRSLIRVPDNHDYVLRIKRDGVHAVEQYVLAKYYLTTNVYRHKVRLITDQMIVRAIVLGIERDEIPEMRKLYEFDNSPEFVGRYAKWDDARFLQVFGRDGKNGKCKVILDRLLRRDLFKRIFAGKPKDFGEEVREQLLPLAKQDPDPEVQKERNAARRRVETGIAGIVGQATQENVDPDFVVYHAFDIKSVKEMSRNDEAPILVDRQPQPVLFEDESSLFGSIKEGFNDEFIEIYAPMTWDHHSDREKLCDLLKGKIIDVIEKELASSIEGTTI